MRVRHGLAALAGLWFVALWPAPAGSGPDKAAADWRKALSLYKRKKYELACPLFEAAAKAKRTNGAIWGDLGLCELKRGNTTESVHASYLAVRYGNDAVRKAAYFNLGMAKAYVPVSSSACEPIASPAELECAEPTYGCTREWHQYGSGMGTDGSTGFFSDDRAHAEELAQFVTDGFGEPDPGVGLPLTRNQRCFAWCARHPQYQCDDSAYCTEGELLNCAVVVVDACRKRLGVFCDEWETPGGPKRSYAAEVELAPRE